jgi:hypothetical protein
MKERVLPPTFNSNIPLNIQEKTNQKTKDKANNHNIKNLGQVSIPASIVDFMLDAVGYKEKKVLSKHILDNSCGDGAFLKSIVKSM